MPQDPWDDRNAHLVPFPDHLLFDIARNDSATRSYRLAAVEILVARKSPRVQHHDLFDFVRELEIELDGIEFVHGTPAGSGPLVASVTTETMQQEDFPQVEFEPLPDSPGLYNWVLPESKYRAALEQALTEEPEECPTTPLSATSDAMEKLPSTPTVASGAIKTPRSTKKASSKPTN